MKLNTPERIDASILLAMLRANGFIGLSQQRAMMEVMDGEESQYMLDIVNQVSATIKTMPKTYEQDGLGDAAIVHLHYFKNGCDWYITEKDMCDEQHQAFGLANLGYGGELGYISLLEITLLNVELDLHWTPKTLAEVRRAAA